MSHATAANYIKHSMNDLSAVFRVMKGEESQCLFYAGYTIPFHNFIKDLIGFGVLTETSDRCILKDQKGNQYRYEVEYPDRTPGNAYFERV